MDSAACHQEHDRRSTPRGLSMRICRARGVPSLSCVQINLPNRGYITLSKMCEEGHTKTTKEWLQKRSKSKSLSSVVSAIGHLESSGCAKGAVGLVHLNREPLTLHHSSGLTYHYVWSTPYTPDYYNRHYANSNSSS